MMHEIRAGNYNKLPILPMWLNLMDQIITFDLKVGFVKDFNRLSYMSDRIYPYTIPIDMNEMYDKYKTSMEIPFSEKDNYLLYMGRWTTMKHPHRLIDMYRTKKTNELKYFYIGMEASVGCKYDINVEPEIADLTSTTPTYGADRKYVANNYTLKTINEYKNKTLQDGIFKDKILCIGPYEYKIGLEIAMHQKFGCSFFNLKEKEKHNYGNRMEYTQMELSCITLPVFDYHWGSNNYNKDNVPFINVPYSAYYINRNNLEKAIDDLIEISKNEIEYNKYREAAFENIKYNYDSENVIPGFYEDIFKNGKKSNIISDTELMKIFGGNKLFENDKLPALQFNNKPGNYYKYKFLNNKTTYIEIKSEKKETKTVIDL
jgi:hypothetical protein